MTKVEKIFQTVGTIIFSIGIALAFGLLAALVWGDLEASLFSTALDAEKSLRTLSCPVFISKNETSQIKATFKNPLDKDWSRFTRVYISDGFITLKREKVRQKSQSRLGERKPSPGRLRQKMRSMTGLYSFISTLMPVTLIHPWMALAAWWWLIFWISLENKSSS